jgi:alpha/beta superfamily hydrolase
MVYGKNDELVPLDNFNSLNKRLSTQTGIKVDFQEIDGANHFFFK